MSFLSFPSFHKGDQRVPSITSLHRNTVQTFVIRSTWLSGYLYSSLQPSFTTDIFLYSFFSSFLPGKVISFLGVFACLSFQIILYGAHLQTRAPSPHTHTTYQTPALSSHLAKLFVAPLKRKLLIRTTQQLDTKPIIMLRRKIISCKKSIQERCELVVRLCKVGGVVSAGTLRYSGGEEAGLNLRSVNCGIGLVEMTAAPWSVLLLRPRMH